METVGAYEAKTHLPKLLERVLKGERITITKHGVPVAVLQSPDLEKTFDIKSVCLSSWLPLDEFFVINRASGACEAQKGLKGGHGRLPSIETEDKLIQIVL